MAQPKSAARKKAASGFVGDPLAPGVLERMGVLADWPPAPTPAFDPAGNWTHTYRIGTCHGYIASGNEDRGVLRIQRVAGPAKDSFALEVTQRVSHNGGLAHELSAHIVCRADALATPIEWLLAGRFKGPDGREAKDLRLDERGDWRDGRLVRTVGKRSIESRTNAHMTGDWCLFEAVQRRAFEASDTSAFDLLEGLTIYRPGQRIAAGDAETLDRTGGPVALHCFHQLGRGLLPVEYWLDEAHRLVLVTTHNRYYVLDPEAEKKNARRRFAPAAKKSAASNPAREEVKGAAR